MALGQMTNQTSFAGLPTAYRRTALSNHRSTANSSRDSTISSCDPRTYFDGPQSIWHRGKAR